MAAQGRAERAGVAERESALLAEKLRRTLAAVREQVAVALDELARSVESKELFSRQAETHVADLRFVINAVRGWAASAAAAAAAAAPVDSARLHTGKAHARAFLTEAPAAGSEGASSPPLAFEAGAAGQSLLERMAASCETAAAFVDWTASVFRKEFSFAKPMLVSARRLMQESSRSDD